MTEFLPALGLRALRAEIRSRLSRSGIANAGQEADWLLRHVLNCTAASLLARPNDSLPQEDRKRLELLLLRREAGEPLQYLLGNAPFRGRDLEVGPGVLIPRPETELLVDLALDVMPNGEFRFLDWGTGSGCIAVALLAERPQSYGFLAEKNPLSLACAWRNLSRYGLLERALLLHSRTPADIPVRAECDLVVSNPPYIPTEAIAGLMREVRDFEPHMALDGGPDGMDFYRALFEAASGWLKPGGLLLFEMGDARQAQALREPPQGKFQFLSELPDLSAIPRCMVWRYRG